MERIACGGGYTGGEASFSGTDFALAAVIPLDKISRGMVGDTAYGIIFAGGVKEHLGFGFAGWGWTFVAFWTRLRRAYVGFPAYVKVAVQVHTTGVGFPQTNIF